MLKLEYLDTRRKMQITSLDKMEEIVNSNKDLYWDGWTVVNRYRSKKASTSKNGVYSNQTWFIDKRFEPNRNGWDIPERFVLGHAQT